MKSRTSILALTALILALGAIAQNADNGKIIVEITKEINGEKKTFKGEYNSTEEMHADPNYQEFAGENETTNFWFDSDEGDVFMHLDQLKNHSGSFFKFFDSDEDANSFFFRLDDDSVDGFFNLHLDDMDMDQYREHMKSLGIEMEEMLKRFNSEDGTRRMSIIEIKRVKITDVDDEFGKKGLVDKSNLLELEDLSFYPNPSTNGRFKIHFQVPHEADLNIKVFNLEGKEVFNRSFDRFSGFYSETIDLSGQKDGIYLLEISQGKKRLTKKIIIN